MCTLPEALVSAEVAHAAALVDVAAAGSADEALITATEEATTAAPATDLMTFMSSMHVLCHSEVSRNRQSRDRCAT